MIESDSLDFITLENNGNKNNLLQNGGSLDEFLQNIFFPYLQLIFSKIKFDPDIFSKIKFDQDIFSQPQPAPAPA